MGVIHVVTNNPASPVSPQPRAPRSLILPLGYASPLHTTAWLYLPGGRLQVASAYDVPVDELPILASSLGPTYSGDHPFKKSDQARESTDHAVTIGDGKVYYIEEILGNGPFKYL